MRAPDERPKEPADAKLRDIPAREPPRKLLLPPRKLLEPPRNPPPENPREPPPKERLA